MRVLVACEYSGIVREAFTKRGHDAWSCDLLDTDKEGQHIIGDVLGVLHEKWDLMIAHPPCTYLSYVGNRHWNKPGRAEQREEAMRFFLELYNCHIDKICIENPLGYPSKVFRKPDQTIHPYQFGDNFMKRTCLWLKNLPPLKIENPLPKPEPLYFLKTTGKAINYTEGIKGYTDKERQKMRQKFWPGIANAMAEQWGEVA